MTKYTWEHIHLRSPDPAATAQWYARQARRRGDPHAAAGRLDADSIWT